MDRVQLRRVVDSVARLCDTATDATVLRIEVLDLLRSVIPFDAHVWVLTDPVTTVGCSPAARVPVLDDLPEIIRAKYLTAENRWTTLDGVGRLSELDPDHASDWRRILGRYGVADVASVVLDDRHGTWAFLDLWRRGATFADDEMSLLGQIRVPLTSALRRCQALTMTALPAPEEELTGTVVVLVDDALRVVGEVEAATEWLARLLPPARDRSPIPAIVYNVAAQLIARESGIDDHPSFARLHIAGGHWISARAARLEAWEGPGLIAVSLNGTTPLERLEVFTRAFGLSERETELVKLLAGGLDTAQLAERMHLSSHTVQDHLKSVFGRTGTRSRPVLLSRALGTAMPG